MSFREQVYELVQKVPAGKVVTYGQIARALGSPRAGRAVGTALHCNPDPAKTPCHRVVNREGRLAPAYAFGGCANQKARLEAEGVLVEDNCVSLWKYQYDFPSE